MGGAIGILGKGRGADPQDELANRERTALVDEPRPGRRPSGPLPAPGMARSGHRCRQGALHAPDGGEGARGRIREALDASDGVCGRRRVHDGPEGGGTAIGERGIARIMGEGDLVARGTARPRRGHSSHRGELSGHPGDRACRDFASGPPDFPWPAGVTRPPMPAGKPCLGPVPGCLDGATVSWTTPAPPGAGMASSMLGAAVRLTRPSERAHLIVHGDRGCHHRWPKWISICDKAGVARPMPRKGPSPDSSRMGGPLRHHEERDVPWEGLGGGRPGRAQTEDRWPHRVARHERDRKLIEFDEPLDMQAELGPCGPGS